PCRAARTKWLAMVRSRMVASLAQALDGSQPGRARTSAFTSGRLSVRVIERATRAGLGLRDLQEGARHDRSPGLTESPRFLHLVARAIRLPAAGRPRRRGAAHRIADPARPATSAAAPGAG